VRADCTVKTRTASRLSAPCCDWRLRPNSPSLETDPVLGLKMGSGTILSLAALRFSRLFNSRPLNNRAWSALHKEDASRVALQFFTMEISVSELRVPVFMFIHGLCRVMLTPFSLNIAPLSPVWMTVTPGSLL